MRKGLVGGNYRLELAVASQVVTSEEEAGQEDEEKEKENEEEHEEKEDKEQEEKWTSLFRNTWVKL